MVVGLVAAGLLIALAFFFLRRKRARKLDEDIRVAAGGAGDGGAGVNRFADEDEDDPFDPSGSEGTHAAFLPTRPSNTMSSYGGVVTMAAGGAAGAGAGGYYAGNRVSGGPPTPSSPSQSHNSYPNLYPSYPAHGPYGGAVFPQTSPPQQRSEEGALYPDWAEYVEASTGDSSPPHGSAEGMGSATSHQSNNIQAGLRDSGESCYGPPLPVNVAADDRLDPNSMMHSDRASQRSLADEHDYTRRILRVANPSEESGPN